MVSLPLCLFLLGAVYVAVRHGKSSVGGMVLGVLLGLAMASTSVGPALVRGLTSLSTMAIRAISSAVGFA
jgi:hypothetical protein